MKMVSISKAEGSYKVKALHPFKIFGIQIMATEKFYKLSDDHTCWYRLDSGKKASHNKQMKLNKWLKDHQKFIEKK